MKAILEFNLPEEQSEFELASNANKYYSILWELDQHLRSKIKYADENTPDLFIETLQMVRDHFWELIEENKIDLDR